MTEFLSYTITGLSLAAILAVAASGLVLTYTTTGVFNFAHGAIGMLGAFAYWQLRFDWGWPTPIAIAVVLLVLGPLFGVFLEVVIFRGLQQTTETIKLVVTVSLLFSIIGIANWIWEPQPCVQRDEVRRAEHHDRRRTGHAPRADHDHRGDPRCDRVALLPVPHPFRCRDARRRRRPPARGAARRPPRPLVDARVGDRLLARGDERDPVRRDDRARRRADVAAHRERVRGGDDRPAPQPAAHLPGRPDPRPADGVLAGLPRREEQPVLRLDVRRRAPGHRAVHRAARAPERAAPRPRDRPHPRVDPDADDARRVHLRVRGDRGRRARDPAPHPRQHRHHGAAVRLRHRRALDGAVDRPRGSGVARAMELRRDRRDHDGAPRCRRHTDGHLLGGHRVRDRRRAHRAPDVAALRDLPRARDRGLRGVPRSLDLRPRSLQPAVHRREDRDLRNGFVERRPARAVRLRVRHRIPAAHAVGDRLRTRRDLRRLAAPLPLRPAAARDEGQPGRVRDRRHEPDVHQARGVRDLGRASPDSAAR